MYKRFNKFIALSIFSLSFINFSLINYAIEKPIQPTGNITNEQIIAYNQQVDKYNKQIDEEYTKKLTEIQQQNKEIEQYNQQIIDNAGGIEQLQAQYEAFYAQYQKDLEIEQKILATGRYNSVEEYNAAIDVYYNIPANTSVEKNTDTSAIFSIDNSYSIAAAEDTSDETDTEPIPAVNVNIKHNFVGYTTYSTSIVIKETDIITFYPAGAQLTPTQPGYASFYMHSDDTYSMGYWELTDAILECTANNSSSGWQNGNTHTVSYNQGKLHPSDSTDVYMTYNYNWHPLETKPTYNIPQEPTCPLKYPIPEPEKEPYLSHMDLISEPEKPQPSNEEPKLEPESVQEQLQEETIINVESIESNTDPIVVVETGTPVPRTAATSDAHYKYQLERISIILACLSVLILIIVFSKDPHEK